MGFVLDEVVFFYWNMCLVGLGEVGFISTGFGFWRLGGLFVVEGGG